MLVPRAPFSFIPSGLPRNAPRKPPFWRRFFAGLDQDFLTDNQLSLWARRDGPGIRALHFYPLPFAHEFTEPKWSFDEIVNHDCLRATGPSLQIQATRTTIRFQPDLVEKRMRVKGGSIRERCAVVGNTLALAWEIAGVRETGIECALPFFAARLEAVPPARDGLGLQSFLVSVRDEVHVALSVSGMGELAVGELSAGTEAPGTGFAAELRGSVGRGGKVSLALSVAYDRGEALRAARTAAARPEEMFGEATRAWDAYLSGVVPRFSCSNKELERLYYYQAYVTRCNLYDIPFEPFTHPYTCPWKTGAVWQWSWNTPLDSVAERWLNDKELGAGGILLEGSNGGAPNMGSYLHPLDRVTALRDRHSYFLAVSAYQKKLGPDYRIEAVSTLPHTTPNGLLGAWEHYLCSQDRGHLRAFLALMAEAEASFSSRELPSGLYACYFVDEFDYSLRWKPYTPGFRKADPQNAFRMETPVVAVDYNCYLYALRERIVEAAAILSSDVALGPDVAEMGRRNAKLRDSINRHLWDEADGFYYDAHPGTLERSGVKCIGAYAALYAGIASPTQAERMVAHLEDPREFGTPYPCPSVSMDTPDADPSVITYGGDSMITSGIWFTTVGLARYGFRDLAARYVARTIQMLTLGGPSSSYSYHSVTGAPNQARHQLAAQSCIATDLVCRYVVGLEPRSGGGIGVDPLALDALGVRSLRFGPYRYGSRSVTVRYDARTGHRVDIAEPAAGTTTYSHKRTK